jgi:hypothetical protein
MTHIHGSDRSQVVLLPEAVDDDVSTDNPAGYSRPSSRERRAPLRIDQAVDEPGLPDEGPRRSRIAPIRGVFARSMGYFVLRMICPC